MEIIHSTKKRIDTKDLVLMGMFAAVLTVISQISLPMPTGVPVTIQVFGVALVAVILGPRMATMTSLVYILIGAIGLPVFANFRGGLGVLAGPTGGYIISWPIMAFFCGLHVTTEHKKHSFLYACIFSIIGLALNELVGALQWAVISGDMTFGAIMAYSFVAFIPKDTILTIVAVVLGRHIRKLLLKSDLF